MTSGTAFRNTAIGEKPQDNERHVMSGSVERVGSHAGTSRDSTGDRLAWPTAALLLAGLCAVSWAGLGALAMVVLY